MFVRAKLDEDVDRQPAIDSVLTSSKKHRLLFGNTYGTDSMQIVTRPHIQSRSHQSIHCPYLAQLLNFFCDSLRGH